MDTRGNPTPLTTYIGVIRRRWLLILLSTAIVAAVAAGYSLHQQKLYQSTAQVLITTANIPDTAIGQLTSPPTGDPTRDANTETNVAHVPEVARRTLTALHLSDRSPSALLSETSITAASDADVLNFSVTDPNKQLARQLVNQYAIQSILYRKQLDTAAIRAAIAGIDSRISALSATIAKQADPDPVLRGQLRTLLVSQQNLQTLEKLQGGKLSLIAPASASSQVQPRLIRNCVAGAALGFILGLGLAFLVQAFDTRVRSADEAARLLHMGLIARVPTPPRSLRHQSELAMLSAGNHLHKEAYRNLRIGFDLANLTVNAETILIVSAVEREGKSTTTANLAVALAGVGRKVAVVDLDLRRPAIAQMFGVDGSPGVTTVAIGAVPLPDAMSQIAVGGAGSAGGAPSSNGVGADPGAAELQVLPAGQPPPDPAVFLASLELSEIVRQLRQQCDVVLIDSPPALAVSDAMTLSPIVDAVLLVVRANIARSGSLRELRRLLDTAPCAKLGFVFTGSDSAANYGYGGGYEGRRESRVAAPPPVVGDAEEASRRNA